MYRTLAACLLLCLPGLSLAQSTAPDPLPNQWINYQQSYFKIPIGSAGLYRVSADELQRAGVPITRIDPPTMQLFHRGVEQAIYVEGEADRRLDTGDFLEFYGRANDGGPDSLLYRPHHVQPHPYYSLFSDTTAYFLTWRLDGKPGKRMVAYADTNDAGLMPEPYHLAEEIRLFTDTYPGYAAGIPPKIEYSHYEAGEGYTGAIQQKDKPYHHTFSLTNTVPAGPAPQLDILLAGRDYTGHRVECWAGSTSSTQRLLGYTDFLTYDNARLWLSANWSDVGADNQLVVSTTSRGNGSDADRYSVSYIRLQYPQKLTTNGQPGQVFKLAPNPIGRSLIAIGNLAADTRFWDITNPTTPIRIGATSTTANAARFVVPNTNATRTILSVSRPKSVSDIRPVSFANWTSRRPTYLIISHEALMQPADGTPNAVQAYAAYRASAAGGGHDTLTVTMQQLFDQFSYGERHPLAIRRFADQMLRQSRGSAKRPQYLLLLGRSRSTPGIRSAPNQAGLDMVMTAGFPGSDVLFTAGLDGQPEHVPALPTGRINAGTAQEVIGYLNKVKEYESAPTDVLWRKNVLHLSGGNSPSEASTLRNFVNYYGSKIVALSLGARVTTRSKQTDSPVERINVARLVNDGLGLMTFFGHSGLDVTDLDIGFCSNDALGYQNKGRYPLMLVNGCAIGNFFFGRPTLVTDWVLTPNRGAIAAIAQSHLGYADILHQYSTTFYDLLADSSQLDKPIGQLQQETIRRLLAQTPDGQLPDGRTLANCQQMVLQGDPAIRPFPFETADYAIRATDLRLEGDKHQPLTAQSDSVRLTAVVQNAGQYRSGPVPVQVRRFVGDRESGVFNLMLPRAVAYQDTVTLTLPNERGAEGMNQFEVTINPAAPNGARPLPETNYTNNRALIDVTVRGPNPVLIYPASGGLVSTNTIRLTASYPTESPRLFDLELDTTARFDSPARITKRILAANSISHQATLSARPGTTFYWRVRLADRADDSAAWSPGVFVYAPDSTRLGWPEGQIRLGSPLPTDVRQGDVVAVPVQFTNLSPFPYKDSVLVRQTIYAAALARPQTTDWRLKAPTVQDTLNFITRIETAKLPGLNRIVLTINPHLEPEYSFQNNTLNLPLPVQPDRLGPVLEVAVDGARISDGAIVSARPTIDVLVADENRSLLRRDTTGLHLYLQGPGHNQVFERLSWRQAAMAPPGADNVFRIRYQSATLPEGLYHLLVTAHDLVGNAAPQYQTSFQVISERRLTDLTVYPNPAHGPVRFAFQLTGDQAPDAVTINLTDLNGRFVRRLTRQVRIGLNEWLWDGRTDAGERLPAGLYLYKLTISAHGQDWPIDSRVNGQLTGRIVLTP